MDVLQLLDDELKAKSNWSLEEKARYLYIRSCELFSYDARYQCDLYWKTFGKKEVKKEILYKKINLRDVDDFKVVCTSYSSYVYKTLLEELLNIFVFSNKGRLQGRIHQTDSFEIGKKKYFVDATGRADIDRIKLGLATNGFYRKMQLKLINNKNLKKIDKKIGYIKDDYFKPKLMQKICNLEKEYYQKTGQNCENDEISYFLICMEILKDFFDKINVFSEYSDAFFCIEYLFNHFFDKDIFQFDIYDENFCFINHDLVDISNGMWNFVNILDIDINDEKFSFVLEPVNGKYEFYEIPISEGNYYKKELRRYNKKI